VREFLSTLWRQANEGQRPGRPSAVLATPPGEQHVLGLHMAAWVVALAGVQVVFLGADTPWSEVAFAAEHHAAQAVVLSVAAGHQADLEAGLAELSARLPPSTALLLGGTGCAGLRSTGQIVNGFEDLFDWSVALARTAGPSLGDVQ
jgi:methylmalonyl-CoA mutase cobalamin-binding subunit